MTHSLPVRTQCAFLYRPRYLPRAQPFSTSLGRRAKRPTGPNYVAGKNPPQPSNTVALKEASKNPPQDNGLMQDTFIMPTGANKPSIFSKPKERLQLEWLRIKMRFQDWKGLIAYKWLTKPRRKLHRRKIIPEALKLHSQMYNAFAEGNTSKLSKICTEGLLSSFRSRIASRPRYQRLRWTLHKHVRRPRLVLDHVARLPIEGSAIRQAVIRLETRQSLIKLKTGLGGKPDTVIGETGEEKNMREYLVLQKRVLREQEGDWMVWGTTREADAKELLGGKA